MLQNIRKSAQGTAAKIIVGLIVASFATFGIQSILVGSGNNDVAEVDGSSISGNELLQAMNMQKNRLLEYYGDRIDPSLLDDNQLKGPVLEMLIQKKLNLNAAEEAGFVINTDALKQEIAQMAEFQQDGQFSPELYQNLLSQNRLSPALFQTLLEEERLTQYLNAGLQASTFITAAELENTSRISLEKRDLRYLTIPQSSFKADIAISDEDIEGYYQEHEDLFMTEESVSLEYIELKEADFYPEVSEDRLNEEYQLRLADYEGQGERRVSHILVEETAEGEQAALDKVQEIQQKIAEGETFAELAKMLSDDKSSASEGGDLGYSDGSIFPNAIEEAVSGLEVMEVSEPVKTDAGWHLLQLTDIAASSAPSYEAMRGEILAELQGQEAKAAIINTVETLKDLVFNADGLAEPASELTLTVKQVGSVTRLEGEGIFADNTLRQVVFTDEVLKEGHNSDVIEVAPNHFVVASVKDHSPSELKPLSDVTAEIADTLKQERLQDLIESKAESLVAELHEGISMEALAEKYDYSWQIEKGVVRSSRQLPAPVVSKLFTMELNNNSAAYDFVALPNSDHIIVELDRIAEGNIDLLPVDQAKQFENLQVKDRSQLINNLYQKALKDRAEIEIL